VSLITAAMVAEAMAPTVIDVSVKGLWPRLSRLIKYGKDDGVSSVLATGVCLAAMRAVTESDSDWSTGKISAWVADMSDCRIFCWISGLISWTGNFTAKYRCIVAFQLRALPAVSLGEDLKRQRIATEHGASS